MISLDAKQTSIMSSSKKDVSWLFWVVDNNEVNYYWSTKVRTKDVGIIWSNVDWEDVDWDDIWTSQYEFKVIDFSGITLRRQKTENYIIAPNAMNFTITNKNDTIDPADLINGTVTVALNISDGSNESVIRSFRFNIKQAEPGYQKIKIICEDFFTQYLSGDYPNTPYASDIFPSNNIDTDESITVPQPFGTCYVPLKGTTILDPSPLTLNTVSAAPGTSDYPYFLSSSSNLTIRAKSYITVSGFANPENNGYMLAWTGIYGSPQYGSPSATNQIKVRYQDIPNGSNFVTEAAGSDITFSQDKTAFILGETEINGDSVTYNITGVRTPREISDENKWDHTEIDVQFSEDDSNGTEWRLYQPLIAKSSVYNDGNDVIGFFKSGSNLLNIPTKFSRSDTASITNPADVIKFVLLDIGVDEDDIDLDSFSTAKDIYTSWGLEFNGAFWEKATRHYSLCSLLNMCHSTFTITQQIGLKILDSTSQLTIGSDKVLKKNNVGEGTFTFRSSSESVLYDSGYVHWQQSNDSQDAFIKTLIPAKASTSIISDEIFKIPFVQDTQNIQKIGSLYYQRKFLKNGTVSFQGKSSLLILEPDDFITINGSNYGGSYPVLIDDLTINKDLSVSFNCTNFSDTLDDWDDLSKDAIVLTDNNVASYWRTVTSGPESTNPVGNSAFEVWGSPYLIVGPNSLRAQYTDIQTALSALEESSHSGIKILDGEYTLTDSIYFPDRNINIIGESRDGVIINSGLISDYMFYADDYTKNLTITDITTVTAATTSGIFSHFKFESTNESSFSGKVIFKNTKSTLSGTGTIIGINKEASVGEMLLDSVEIVNGDYGFFHPDTDTSNIKILNSIFTNQSEKAIWLDNDSKYATINKNIINGASGGSGISVASDTVIVTDNFIKTTQARCLHIYSDSNSKAIVTGNDIQFTDPATGYTNAVLLGSKSNLTFSNNNIKMANGNASSDDLLITAIALYYSDNIVSSNTIEIDSDSRDWGVRGIDVDATSGTLDKLQINNNVIKIDVSATTYNHYGIYLDDSQGNTIQGNQIDMVNNDAKDIGINITSNSDNNTGVDNVTSNVGTSISDSGTGNTITATDI